MELHSLAVLTTIRVLWQEGGASQGGCYRLATVACPATWMVMPIGAAPILQCEVARRGQHDACH